MKNQFILLELNQRNEIRADVNLTIKSLGITEIENINGKPYIFCSDLLNRKRSRHPLAPILPKADKTSSIPSRIRYAPIK